MHYFFLTLRPIQSIEALEERIDLRDMSKYCGGEVINSLEHVEVKVNLIYSRRGDLLIKITSPGGTVSNLTHYRKSDSFFKLKDLKNWTLMTLHLWGETAVGEWKLSLKNSQTQHANEGWLLFQNKKEHLPFYDFYFVFSWQGTLFGWTLILHGTTLNPFVQARDQPTISKPPTGKTTNSKTPTSGITNGPIVNRRILLTSKGTSKHFFLYRACGCLFASLCLCESDGCH